MMIYYIFISTSASDNNDGFGGHFNVDSGRFSYCYFESAKAAYGGDVNIRGTDVTTDHCDFVRCTANNQDH